MMLIQKKMNEAKEITRTATCGIVYSSALIELFQFESVLQ